MSKNRLTALRGASIASALVVLPVATFASCAASEKESAGPPPDVSVTWDAGDAADDVAPEVGCASTEAGCPLTCADAPWCPVPITLSPYATLTAVWGSGKNDVWAVGSNGTVVHWDGAAWTSIPLQVTNTFNTVWGSGPNDVWIASATDSVFRAKGFSGATTKFEREGTPLPSDGHVPVRRIWGTSPDDVILAGHRYDLPAGEWDYIVGNMLRRGSDGDGGVGWLPILGEENVLALWGTSSEDLWITADGSSSAPWKVSMTYHGKPGPDGTLEWTNVDSRSSAALRALWGSSASDIWAVGDVGTIRHLTNTTASEWTITPSPTREDLYGLWGSAADDVWAVGAAGAILHYDGKGWSEVLAAFPAGQKPDLRGVWGSAKNDVWIVGDGVTLHYDGRPLAADAGGGR